MDKRRKGDLRKNSFRPFHEESYISLKASLISGGGEGYTWVNWGCHADLEKVTCHLLPCHSFTLV